jgi:hypothetical protein
MLDSYNVDAQVEMVGDDMVVRVKQGEGNIALLCLNLQRFKVFNKEARHQVYTFKCLGKNLPWTLEPHMASIQFI